MKRPLHLWLAFAVCAAVLLGAVTWVTATAVKLQRAQTDAARQAQLEEKVRLALWRMDSLLAPLIVQESAWPVFAGHAEAGGRNAIPSSTNVLLHFQVGPDGNLTSPDVHEGMAKGSLKPAGGDEVLATNRARFAQLTALLDREALLAACPPATISASNWIAQLSAPPRPLPLPIPPSAPAQQVQQQAQVAQILQNNQEFQARAQTYRQVADNFGNALAAGPGMLDRMEGPLKPLWFSNALVLARRVTIGGRDYIRGTWLNWPALERLLLDNTRDLLPGARLEPISAIPSNHDARLLASIPARIIPGTTESMMAPPASPLRFALVAAWSCMLLAALAVGALLHGVISLSERRAAFVSAVTHEMRTPLTTFKLYSEMLAGGFVRDAPQRAQYLKTLCAEANRLSHLVENVLAYARLERGRAARRIERLRLGELLERIRPRLEERAAQAGMAMIVDADESMLRTVVNVDTGAVEQILFNLVDNACKYAAPHAAEKTIHLEALPDGKFAMLRVRDHGQGISEAGVRRLFQPFSKSAEEAAHTAPGIGLGLALCRRLSRSIGGDLQLARDQPGACFELRLPLTANADPAALNSI